ncbi:hypothetical protein NUG14_00555 [Bacillus amyloliquefaciens]|nr:hypothetical protein [Bacillus amyloliquefaciens]MCR4369615.1 hypothetical protein [Bacillus amyloliquefaciens]
MAVLTGVFTKKAITRIAHAAAVRRLHGSGLFLNTCREVAEQYPEVDDYHIDAMTVHLGSSAAWGLHCQLIQMGKQAMAQAAQGSAPDIAGKILRILSVLYFQLLCCLNGSVHSIVIKS